MKYFATYIKGNAYDYVLCRIHINTQNTSNSAEVRSQMHDMQKKINKILWPQINN